MNIEMLLQGKRDSDTAFFALEEAMDLEANGLPWPQELTARENLLLAAQFDASHYEEEACRHFYPPLPNNTPEEQVLRAINMPIPISSIEWMIKKSQKTIKFIGNLAAGDEEIEGWLNQLTSALEDAKAVIMVVGSYK